MRLFNDPYDCRLTVNFKDLNSSNKKETFIRKATIKVFNELQNSGRYIDEEMISLERKLNNIDEFQINHDITQKNMQDEYYGVISLSTEWNNMLMWAHYSDNHKGYCIGLDEASLIKEGLINKHKGIKGGIVKYKRDFPVIDPITSLEMDPTEKGFIITHTKACDWRYESEYRIMKVFDIHEEKQNRILNYPDTAIVEVIIGSSIGKEDRNEIEQECKSRNLNLYKLSFDKFKYQAEKERIEL